MAGLIRSSTLIRLRRSIGLTLIAGLIAQIALPVAPVQAAGGLPVQEIYTSYEATIGYTPDWPGSNGDSDAPAISADGRYVAFSSKATNLLAGETPGEESAQDLQVYIHDRLSRRTELVSKALGGDPANGSSSDVSISADGSRIAFVSDADNLVMDDLNGVPDIFVWSRSDGRIQRVSVSEEDEATQTPSTEFIAVSENPSLSADGRYVLFESESSHLDLSVPPAGVPTEGYDNVYRYDLTTGEIDRMWLPFFGMFEDAVISGDGRYVAFVGDSSLYRYDFESHSVDQLLEGSFLEEGNSFEYDSPAISGDGEVIVFRESAWVGHEYDSSTIKVIDLANGRTVTSIGPGFDYQERTSVSPNGRYVAYVASTLYYPDLAPADALDQDYDVYLYDRERGEVERAASLATASRASDPSVADTGAIAVDSYDDIRVVYRADESVGWDSGSLSFTGAGSEVYVNWPSPTQAGDIRGFHIYRENAANYVSFLGSADGDARSFAIAGFVPKTSDKFYVFAINDSYDASAIPLAGNFRIPDTEPPYWVGGDAGLRTANVTSNSVRLEWNAATDASTIYYTVWRVENETRTPLTWTSATYANLNGLSQDTSYTVVITAGDASGMAGGNQSAASAELTFRTLAASVQIGTLGGSFANGGVTLTWTPSELATGAEAYRITRAIAGGSGAQLATVAAATTTYTDLSVIKGDVYTYQVQGYDANNVLVYQTNPAEVAAGTLALPTIEYAIPSQNEQLEVGESIELTAQAEPSRNVQAIVRYESWYDDANKKRAYPIVKQAAIPLTEGTESGVYAGTWSVPEGTSSVVSVQASILTSGAPVTGNIVRADLLTEAGAEVVFNLSHLDASLRTLLEQALMTEEADIVVRVGEEEFVDSFEGFDHVYPFPGLKSGVDATVSAGTLFAPVTLKLQPGFMNRVSFSSVKSNPTLTVSVTDSGGKPVPNLTVKYYDSKGDERFRGITGEDGIVQTSRLALGSGQVTVDVRGTKYEPQAAKPATVSLAPATVSFVLDPVETAVLSGKVADAFGLPIENVTVQLSQLINGAYALSSGVSGADGRYVVSGFVGEADIALYGGVSGKQYRFPDKVTRSLLSTGTGYDPVVERYEEGFVFLRVFYKTLEGTIKGPITLDAETLRQLDVRVRGVNGDWRAYGNPVSIWGIAGSEIEVCIGGYENQDPVCESAVTDQDNSALVEVTIEEMSRLEANFTDNGASYQVEDLVIRLERWNEEESRWATFQWLYGRNPLRMSLPVGTFRYEASTFRGILHASGEFTTKQGDLVQLGNVPLLRGGLFSGQPGNGLVTTAKQALPGEMITFKGSYRNGGGELYTGAKLVMEAPAGTTIVPGSVRVTGPGTVDEENGVAIVRLGTMAPLQEGTVSYQLRLTDGYSASELEAKLRLVWSGGDEVLGRQKLSTALVSLEAPGTVYLATVQVSGRAPGGSIVAIYDGDELVGQTIAYTGGYWSKQVTLSERGRPSRHAMRAEVRVDGSTYRSQTRTILYAPEQVRLQELVMKQFNGVEKAIQPENGLARFPFVIHPSMPTSFAAYFTDPDRIDTAMIRFAGEEYVPLERDENGVFRADIVPGYEAGDVYVEYTTKPEPLLTRKDGAELKASLPPELRNFEDTYEEIEADPDTGSIGGAAFDFGDYRVRSETLILPDDGYQPTEEELLAEAEGHPPSVYGASLAWSVTGTAVTLQMSYYMEIDDTVTFAKAVDAPRNEVRMLKGARQKVVNKIKLDSKDANRAEKMLEKAEEFQENVETGIDVVDTLRDSFDMAIDFSSRMDRLGALAQLAATCPKTNEIWNSHILRAIELAGKLSTYTMVLKVVDYLNPIPFDRIGLDPFGDAIDHINENLIDSMIQRLEGSVLKSNRIECGPDKDNPDKWGSSRGGSLGGGSLGGGDGSGSGGSGSGSGGGAVASPAYIYDPSGFIYEGFEDNRVVDATATIYQLIEGVWAPWDAEWYGQINPQSTDTAGKYGWDVPFGTWQVIVTKEGYLQTQSEELVVPPQHFDVNLPITSMAPPTIDSVRAWAVAGSAGEIVLTFTKPIDVSLLDEGSVTVVRDGAVLAGSLDPVEVQLGVGGKSLTLTVRVTLDDPLQAGDEVEVYVDGTSIVSYAGVALDGIANRSATAELKDVAGPVLQSAIVVSGGRAIALTFDERVDSDSLFSVDGITLTGTKAAPLAMTLDSGKADGRTVKLLLTRPIVYSDNVSLSLAAGRIEDTAGNGSAAITNRGVGNPLPSGVSRLSALNVKADGANVPLSFDSGKSRYEVNVAIGKKITVTPTALSHDARISIDGKPYLGTPITVAAEESTNEAVIVVTAQDGRTQSIYSLTINRVEPGAEPPSTGLIGQVAEPSGAEYSFTVEDILSALADGKAVLELENDAGEQTVFIPSEALRRLVAERGDSIVVQTPDVALDIPLAGLDLTGIAEKLGADAKLRLRIGRLEGSAAAELLNKARSGEGQFSRANVVFTFELQAEAGGSIVPITSFGGQYVSGEIRLTAALPDAEYAGVYRLNESSGEWERMPSQSDAASGTIRFKTPTFSAYTAMSYKVAFHDVQKHWAEGAIAELAAKQIVQGVGQGKFAPSRSVTRAEFAALLVRALAAKKPLGSAAAVPYKDVSVSDWYYDDVAQATALGIASGLGDGTFRPNAAITREEMAIMLARALTAAGVPGVGNGDAEALLGQFVDGEAIHAWAKAAVARTVGAGLMVGTVKNAFAPGDYATRAEAVTVLSRFLAQAPF